jgi:tetratricopeptide (TPR) repeat protein
MYVAVDFGERSGDERIDRLMAYEATALRYGRQGDNSLELTRSLPPAPNRNRRELDLHLTLGRMIRMAKGMAAPDTLQVFSRARELLDETSSVEEHITVLYGLWGVHYVRAEHNAAQSVSQQFLTIAEQYQDDEALALGHYILGDTLWATGAFIDAQSHLECILELYGPLDRSGTAGTLQHNYDVNALTFLGWALWRLGYPEQASRAVTEAIARARQIGHVPLLAFALHAGALLDIGFAEMQSNSEIADETVAFCAQHGVAAYELWAHFWQGAAIARRGDLRQGIDVMEASMAAAAKIEAKLFRPLHLGQLAIAYAHREAPEIAISLVEEALATSKATNERFYDAELHRNRGDFFMTIGKSDLAELALQEALVLARAQKARLWELRAATSLTRLWWNQNRRTEAQDLLRPLYGWFREGLETQDLRLAKEFIE